jgi:hypothetical protein
VIRGRWKMIVRAGSTEFQLYDLATDPLETADVAAANPEVIEDLKRVMLGTIERARAQGEKYGAQQVLGLSETERGRLDDLGYLGGK